MCQAMNKVGIRSVIIDARKDNTNALRFIRKYRIVSLVKMKRICTTKLMSR